jgi:hypothetical protein
MKTLPNKKKINFNCGKIENIPADVGAYMHYYLQEHPELRVQYFHPRYFAADSTAHLCPACKETMNFVCAHNTEILKQKGCSPDAIKLLHSGMINIEFILNENFLHYRGGGNWDYKSELYHANKTKLLNQFIDELLQ